MTTVNQAFDGLRQALELTEAEREEASRQQNVVRENLDSHLGGVERHFLSGSYSRRTAIRPLHDIDIFLVLDKAIHKDVYPSAFGSSPTKCLEKVAAVLHTAYQKRITPTLQGRSVNIEFKGTGIGYDIVPAFPIKGDDYMIPDRDRKSWISTNPEKHCEVCIKANERAGGKLNSLIKMAKEWNTRAGKPLRSFHLEVMSYEAFSTPPAGYPEGLHALLAFLADRVLSVCAEPAGIGPNIDAGMTQEERTRARTALKRAAEQAAAALDLDRDGKTEQAHAVWRELLGPAYPEKGRPR